MTFTESDANNDGLIKREVGREMAKVAKTQNPQLFQHFQNVCEEVGRDPSEVFGEMAVRSLNSEAFAEDVLASEISMSQIKADEIRLEDVKYVKELSDELGLNDTEDGHDPIDELINKRLKSVASSPIDNLTSNRKNPEGVNGEVLQHMESLQQEISRLEQKIEGEDVEATTTSQTSEPNEQSVDDLFEPGGSGGGNGQDNKTEEESVVEVERDEEQGPNETQETEAETVATDEEIEEALEGTVGEVDGVWDEEIEEEMEQQGSEKEADDVVPDFVTSGDGEEE